MDYDRIRASARRMLAKAKQGQVILTRETITPGENRWDDPTISKEDEDLVAVVSGIAAEFVDGSTVLASDRQVLCAPPAMGIRPGDILTIDGKPVTLIRQVPIPAAGEPAALRVIVR